MAAGEGGSSAEIACLPAHGLAWPQLEIYYQVGPAGACSAAAARAHAVLDLLEQVLYEPCYDTLRTKQQLGYSVHSGTRLTHGVSGLVVQIIR